MNRNELIDYIRDPASLTSESLTQLEEIVAEAPYFQSARMLLAKGSTILKDPASKKRISSAAIYATDRPLLKKYISGNLLFLTKPPEKSDETKAEVATPASKDQPGTKTPDRIDKTVTKETIPEKPAEESEFGEDNKLFIPGIPSGALDVMLEELEQDMEDLKSSRLKFADLQEQIADDEKAGAEKESSITDEVELQQEPADPSSAEELKMEEEESEPEPSQDPFKRKDAASEEVSSEPAQEKPAEIKSDEPVTPEADAPVDEEDEMEKAIAAKLENLEKDKLIVPKDKGDEQPAEQEDEQTKATESDLGGGITEIKLESELRMAQRLERRQEREKRLSNLNKLSPTSIKKLEDQMWGDGDDDAKVPAEAEKDSPAKSSSIGEASAKKKTEKPAEKKENKSAEKKAEKLAKEKKDKPAGKKVEASGEKEKTSPAKSTETSSVKKEKKTASKSVASKTEKKETTKKSSEKKKSVAKTTTKKAAAKTAAKKPGAKSKAKAKPKSARAAATPKSAAKTTTRKSATKGTTKTSTTKKTTSKKKMTTTAKETVRKSRTN